MTLKFAYVAGCFIIALLSYFICHSKRDWAWLVSGLAFTLGADYFLVLQNNHLYGVAIFCFAHLCYIMRAVTTDVANPTTCSGVNNVGRRRMVAGAWGVKFLGFTLLTVITILVAVAFISGSVIALAVIYASLFVVNIAVNFRFFGNEKTRLPKLNRVLVLTGLVLFVLCDINVLLINLPRYFGAPQWLSSFFPLIWVFYLPSQILLAVSAIAFPRITNND